jgi:hypothetical protein
MGQTRQLRRTKEAGMKQRLHTYRAYSVGCALVWAAILGGAATRQDRTGLHVLSLVGIGWWSGWLSATMARAYYPR